MKPTLQPGMHPDAETLTAFAEQLVTGAEREEVLAHMAECGRCREVAFLAQQAAGEHLIQKSPELSDERPRREWFANWRWAWIPLAAVAGIVGIAVVQHERHGSVSEARLAQNAVPPEVMQGKAPSKHAEAPPAQLQLRAEPKQKSNAPARSDREGEAERRSLDQKDAAILAEKKGKSAQQAESQAAAPRDLPGGTVHGTFTARAKSSSVGGPLAQNQMQAQNNAQLQQLNVNQARQADSLADATNKPALSSQSGASAQSVTAQVDAAIVSASPAPAAAPALAAKSTQSETVEASGRALDKLKAAPASLPSKLGVVSEARADGTLVAIDTAGAVFLSEDSGHHWQAVDARWTGRAVLVKLRPSTAAGASLKQSTPQFELSTDTPETWTSADGKNWALETASPQ